MERALYVLGTASQVPTVKRNHNGFFLRWDREGILFDPGEGTQRQMAMAGLAASDITRICVTHFHGDHCLGLPGVVQRLSLDNVTRPVEVYFPASGRVYFDRLRKASIFASVEQLVPRPISEGGVVAELDDLMIEAWPLRHAVDCYGYRIQEKDRVRFAPELLAARGVRGPAVGQLQREGRVRVGEAEVRRWDVTEINPGQAMAFVMDTAVCEGARRLAKGVDALVCESTFLASDADLAEKSGHMTAPQAAELARDAGARLLVLTHFSQRYPDAEVYLDEARPLFPEVVAAVEPTPGSDGHRIPLPARVDPKIEGDFVVELLLDGEPQRSQHQGRIARVRAALEGLAERAVEAGLNVTGRRIFHVSDAGEVLVFERR